MALNWFVLTHPTTNWALCQAAVFIKTNALPFNLAATLLLIVMLIAQVTVTASTGLMQPVKSCSGHCPDFSRGDLLGVSTCCAPAVFLQ